MTFILNIIFSMTAGILITVYANECNLIEDKSASLQLFRHLFCEYETSERPTTDPKNTTVVSFLILPKMIEFEDFTNTLNVHSWMYISWQDQYLQWKASDFSDIDSIWVQSYRIWTPDFAIQNAASADSIQMSIPLTNCMLAETGVVVCVPPTRISTRCDADYSYWPFDRQNCNIQISSWAYNSNEITFRNDRFDIILAHYEPNGEWNIISVRSEFINKTAKYSKYDEFPTIVAHFVLQRVNSQLWRVYGTPTIILAVMTLSTLWLDPKSNERLMLGCVNFLCHFLCIGNLHWLLPESNSLPNILMFYHNSIILAVVALVLTCLFRRFIDAKDPPPLWISSLVSTILTSKVGQILLLCILDPKASARLEDNADDNSDLVNRQTPKTSTWAYVAIILGWISFISVLLTYIITFAMFLRMPNMKE